LISSEVIVDTPGACKFCWAAVITNLSSVSASLFFLVFGISLTAVLSLSAGAFASVTAAKEDRENADEPRAKPISVAKE